MLAAANVAEIIGLLTGVLCVWLLVRQNIWTWPVGIVYIMASLYVFHEARLYANFLLHVFYFAMSCYGWHYWYSGGQRSEKGLVVSKEQPVTLWILTVSALLMALLGGMLLNQFTNATLPFWDNTVSMLSLLAMWLQSRKKLQSWYYWLVIDVTSIIIYLYTEIYFYSLLYALYTILAMMGLRAWQRSLP
jgi:nicotinamide mononucleotide transporter